MEENERKPAEPEKAAAPSAQTPENTAATCSNPKWKP